jgi:hypothetical protein
MSLAVYADTPIMERMVRESLIRAGFASESSQYNQGHLDICICVGEHPDKFLPPDTSGVRLNIALSPNPVTEKNKGTLYFQTPFRFGLLADHILMWGRTVLCTSCDDLYRIGDYTLKTKENTIERDQTVTRLTDKEKDILVALLTAPQKTLSRQELMDRVWAYADGVETHTLETHIYRLRQKIEKDPAHPAVLVTLPDGYTIKI